MFHSWNQAFRIIGFLGRSRNINLAWCWEQGEGRLIWSYYVFSVVRCLGIIIITPSFRPFSIVFSNQRFSNCSSIVDIGFVKLLSNCFCGNRVFKMNTELCCHLCCSISLIFRHNPLHLVWFSVTIPLSWWCLPVICVCLNNLETAALVTPNKVAGLVADVPAKCAPTICPLWKYDKSPILQYFHMSCYRTESVMHWHWHYRA